MEEDFTLPDIEPSDLGSEPILILGCGTVGRRVATGLAQWGAPRLHLRDFDVVEPHNVLGRSAQGYTQSDIGELKVDALRSALYAYNPKILISTDNGKILDIERLSGFVFACVDDMDTRVCIRDSVFESPEVRLLCEARITDTSGRVFALNPHNIEHRARYGDISLWYSNTEATRGGCGSPLMYPLTAVDASRLMLGSLFSYLRRRKGSSEPFVNMTRFISTPSFFVEEEVWC